MVENKVWYVNTNRQTYGPYEKDEIVAMLKDGSVQYSDYIFKEGFAGWDFIYNVQEFDRRLLNPGGDQPIVEQPKATVQVAPEEVEKSSTVKEGEDLWYVHDGQNQTGPYASNYIREALNNKTLFWTYYVWRDGFDNWVQIKDCKEFDRRTKPRGDSPVGLDITTDYDQIKEQAVHTLPQAEGAMYGDVSHPVNFQYGVSDIDQNELRGKYPIKAIIFLIVLASLLFGGVRAYPWFIQRTKENTAMNMYNKGVDFIEKKKYEQGFNLLKDLPDMYPKTMAARKSQNYVRAKEPMVKSQLADEARKVRGNIESYVRMYGILPSNAVDISYTPTFWVKYFAEFYYKKDASGKVGIMIKGNKPPVDGYVFTSEGTNAESESELTSTEFETKAQNYIKLIYSGSRTSVRPINVPQLLKKPAPVVVPSKPVEEEKVVEEPKKETRKEKVSRAKKEAKKYIEEVDDENPDNTEEPQQQQQPQMIQPQQQAPQQQGPQQQSTGG